MLRGIMEFEKAEILKKKIEYLENYQIEVSDCKCKISNDVDVFSMFQRRCMSHMSIT